MTTLYDLLGARPGDDAASLKTAFRNAVKASHPDLHTDDPEAPSRFGEIVRANEILRDAEQRKAYDQLLAFELWQHHARSPPPGIISQTMRHLASDAIAVAFLALALTGGYVLLTRAAKPSVPTIQIAEDLARGRPEPAPDNPQEQVILVSRQELHELLEGPGAAAEVSTLRPPVAEESDAAVKDGGATKDNLAKVDATMDVVDVGAAPDRPSSDASLGNADLGDAKSSDAKSGDPQFFRKRGMAAYRDGDLDRALADFDQAIRLAPDSATAYIDRGIVFYRKAESERAFADIAQATRIEISRRPPAAPSKPQKTSAARKP